ncbi:hypothetical protein R7J54_13630 [Acinetobacter baumannii]|uniref:hypothetical protein n=1 Tax=Acinetobacter TaxID=469 RepID=UPI0002B93513|nr:MULTISPECIES: hypothetical protein [Acinetobacter]AYX91705.1 hypothetical protein EG365_02850 [Acinetobacter sp. FDAARGOS_494]EHU2873698.1 hypothetical protein [Acinetobacter baumannii]EHU2968450.1 hypothetical protein [Acinetobacter baumannii]EHU3004910.1 hypothetical protein [Acinetobacter baumannii]EHU3085076.1 hypothetical protein [Acinetobacter baumannii]
MKRIDSVNARPDMFGTGKKGFHSNEDVPGQDATYLTPEWCNMVQEEIANVLEKHGVVLNPNNRQQLYELLATYPDLENLADAIEARFAAEAAFNKNARDELQAQITALLNYVSYPRILASGVFYYNGGEGGGTVTMIGGTDGWTADNDKIKAPDIYNLTDRNIGIFLSPEAANEAPSFDRDINSFKPKIHNRSGTNRIGYSGQVSFQVLQHKNPNSTTVDGDYPAGLYSFVLQPGETKLFTLIGAGGGGGASRRSNNSSYPLSNGQAGADLLLKVNGENIAVVHGGGGGTQGVWSNGSAYDNGQAGAVGAVDIIGAFDSTTITQGKVGNATKEDHTGGASVSPIALFGKGGDGAMGIGDEGWSFGGGGASGSVLVAQYTNNSTTNQTITLVVGRGGAGGQKGGYDSDIIGGKGTDGFARVASV